MAHNRYTRYLVLVLAILSVIYFTGLADRAPAKYFPTEQSSKQQPHLTSTHDIPQTGQAPPVPVDNSKLKHVPDVSPGHQPRINATFVSLARNDDLWEIARSVRQVEDRFNYNYHYDWVFLNDQEFSDDFKKTMSALVSGRARFGVIPNENWSYPPWIDQSKAAQTRKEMKQDNVIYGDSESYRHMCRFESGFFFQQKLMLEYDYYWRVEPSVSFYCDLPYDPFRYMMENKKKYSFTITLPEFSKTVRTLWDSTKKFIQQNPQYVAENNLQGFVSNDDGQTYNMCHFWSNFEIGSLDFLRSPAYVDYFNFLDKEGGFFYERWGDAPVHSIAASLFLKKDEIHFFDDIGYKHAPFTHCPNDPARRLELRCSCDPKESFDWVDHSCLNKYFDAAGLQRPVGYEPKN